jgi:probable rRNA maturation factor
MSIFIQFGEGFLPSPADEPAYTALLEEAAQAALIHNAVERSTDPQQRTDLTVVMTGDEAIQELNRTYLAIDAPTDVLSFPADEIDPDTQARYLGDVIISFPRAQAQAVLGGHSVEAELQLLVVHGVLHCLGYDHAEPVEKAKMWAIQAEILDQIGCPIRLPIEG